MIQHAALSPWSSPARSLGRAVDTCSTRDVVSSYPRRSGTYVLCQVGGSHANFSQTVNPKDLILNPPLALPSPQDDGTELFKRVDHASPDIQAPRARSRSRDFVSPPRLNRNKTKAPRVRFEPSSEPAPRPKKKAATKKTIQSRPTHTKLLKDLGKDEDIENKAAAEKKAAEEDAKAAAARQKADEKRQIARLRSAAKRAAESARKEARRVADRRRAAVKRATRLAEREAAAQHNAARRIVKLKSRAACEKWAELTTKGGE